MPEFLRLALDYTEAMIPELKENARKIFGCRGILINSVNTPDSGLYKCMARHIVNWTGGAAWFAQHFYDYFRYTQDMDYLKEHAMPFMYETALFYEDFVVENEDGYYDLLSSVSRKIQHLRCLKHGNWMVLKLAKMLPWKLLC